MLEVKGWTRTLQGNAILREVVVGKLHCVPLRLKRNFLAKGLSFHSSKQRPKGNNYNVHYCVAAYIKVKLGSDGCQVLIGTVSS